MTKYRNIERKCLSGHKHDSIKEAGHCDVLLAMKQNSEIIDYAVGTPIELIPPIMNSQGEKIRAMTYTPDFVVFREGVTEYVDVKSKVTKTQAFILKWKLLQYKYQNDKGYRFTIVC